MGVFDKLLPGKDPAIEEQQRAEKAARDFTREQGFFESASNEHAYDVQEHEKRADLLRWQQDLDDEMNILINQLLGYQRTKEGWKKVTEALCNMKFITDVIIPHCKPYLTRNLINTNWDERTILLTLKNSMNTIADAMSDGWDEYDIDFTKWDNVLSDIKVTCKAGAYRSLNGWTKRIDSTMIKRIESMSEQQQQPQPKKGLMGVFKSG